MQIESCPTARACSFCSWAQNNFVVGQVDYTLPVGERCFFFGGGGEFEKISIMEVP